MTYPGGKNGCGSYQRIIGHMPPHGVYVEAFLGSGAVLRNKRPAARNVAIDADQKAIDLCRSLIDIDIPNIDFIHGNDLQYLNAAGCHALGADALIYCDPPYLMETRKGGDLYDHELSDQDHVRLLEILNRLPCMVMLSGYRGDLYDATLKDWQRVDYMTQTRRGMVPESLWMNFPAPVALHDYSHLGSDYRERERIKRKKARWVAKIENMDRLERLALMDALTTTVASDAVPKRREAISVKSKSRRAA